MCFKAKTSLFVRLNVKWQMHQPKISQTKKLGTAARLSESYGFGAKKSETATSWNINSSNSTLVVLFLSRNIDILVNLIAQEIAPKNKPWTTDEVEQLLGSDRDSKAMSPWIYLRTIMESPHSRYLPPSLVGVQQILPVLKVPA